ncbi:mannose-6-phosphate isomerase, class I [Pengzhenrongella frigida]|nr:mannose-6-phosphate isomerase, class I [Cellulomonas sp. HLT2-17]
MLTNPWLRYAWGSVDLLPALLHQRPDGRPVAEIWMGAHAALPSSIEIGDREVGLDEFVEGSPDEALGAEVARQTGAHLPFMLKFLAAGQPLSLQVHPTRPQAEEGYRREDAAGIPLNDPARNYRDREHKPEMLYALTPFDMMCGFRPVEVISELLKGLHVPDLDPIVGHLDASDPAEALRSALTALLTAEPTVQQHVTAAVVASALAHRDERPEYSLVVELAESFPHDIGIVASLFLNVLRVEPGESVFIGPGMIHSYIRGLGLELMATSNNVLRAGLTAKHVDAPEMLRLVSFASGEPERLRPAPSGGATVFTPPVTDFALWAYLPAGPDDFGTRVSLIPPASGARIAVCCAGHCTLTCGDQRLVLQPGQSAFLPDADGAIEMTTTGTVAVAYAP